jgi:hypothetical protein
MIEGWDYVTDADGRSTPIPPVGQLCTCYVEDLGHKQAWATVPDCPFHGRRVNA